MSSSAGDLSQEICAELDSIVNTLGITRTNFLTEFNEADASMEAYQQTHTEWMKKHKGHVEELHGSLRQLQNQGMSKLKACELAEEKLKDMQDKLELLKEDTDALLRDKEVTNEKVQQLQENNKKKQEQLSVQEKAMAQTVVELEKSADFFRDRLGLSFKKISEGRLQVIFSNIDPKEPSSVCFFCVKINPDRSYEVTECDPSLPQQADLVEKLNSTNNFRSFIIAVRKQFKKAL